MRFLLNACINKGACSVLQKLKSTLEVASRCQDAFDHIPHTPSSTS
jgi:hypothetical protein